MSTRNLCQTSQVHRLYSLYLHFDASHSAKHEDPECRAVLDQCFQLLEKDYIVGRVDNRNGQLCSTYPAELAILEGVRDNTTKDCLEPVPSRDHLEHAQSDSFIHPVPAAHTPPKAGRPQQQQPQHADIPIGVAPQASAFQVPPLHGSPLPPPPPHDPAGEMDHDQSYDLDDSSMMSFQDIRAELDLVHPNSLDHALLASQTNAQFGLNDTQELLRLFEKSHFARVRARFVVPCILVRGKNVCRSGTLSNEVEVFMHNVNQKFNDLNQKRKTFMYGAGEKSPDKEDRESSLTKQRSEDIALLHRLGVAYINDLMVENRKVKYGLKVTSSEKVDSFGRYSSFKLVATPYPGVEFFQQFKANKYSARKLRFDWSQTFADADLQLPSGHTDNLGIPWKDYKQWDLIELTQNYLRLYLNFIADGTYDPFSPARPSTVDPSGSSSSGIFKENVLTPHGLLIHCISGWDRTPLFISLLRISLWADGEIHSSLSAAELLYLTMGYDWFLFNDDFSLQHITRVAQEKPRHDGAKNSSPSEGSADDICQSCRCLSPSERIRLYGGSGSCGDTGGSAPKNDASSSVDGKPSSWQFVSFAAGPAAMTSLSSCKDSQPRYGSPRGSVNGNGGPLAGGRSIPTSTAGASSLSSRCPPLTGTPSPSQGGFRAAYQNLAGSNSNRRPSPSNLPSHSPGPYATTPSKLGGCEMMRTATSPDIGSSIAVGSGGSTSSNVRECPERSTRKRASTFDGGLLIRSDASAIHSNDGHESDDEEEKDDRDMEDLTSSDDAEHDETGHDRLFTPSHPADVPRKSTIPRRSKSPRQHRYQECRYCHQQFAMARSRCTDDHRGSCGGVEKTNGSTTTLDTKEGTLRYDQGNRVGSGSSCTSFASFPGDKDQRSQRPQNQCPADSDREEVFQLEIEDSRATATTNNSGNNSGSNINRCRQTDLVQQRQLNSNVSPAMSRKKKSLLDLLQVDRRAEANDEHDENEGRENVESRRDGTTGGRERFSLSEGEWDHQSSSSRSGSQYARRASVSSSFGAKICGRRRGSRSELEDEDDDDDDDDGDEGMAGSLGSLQCGLNLEQLQNDRMFMPSLQGVFSSSEESVGYAGLLAKNGRTPLVAHGGAVTDGTHQQKRQQQSQQLQVKQPQNKQQQRQQEQQQQQQRRRASRPSLITEPSPHGDETSQRTESLKRATRRQRLREIRRLFMEMRHEIGDGSQPPSRGGRHLLVAAAATASSAVAGAAGVAGITGVSGTGNGTTTSGYVDDPSDPMLSSAHTDENSATTFPFVFDLPRHHQHHLEHPYEHHQHRHQRRHQSQESLYPASLDGHQAALSATAAPSAHNYVTSFFGAKSPSPPLRDSSAVGLGAEEASLSVPSVATGRKSPFEWAAAAAASISAGITLHGSQQHPYSRDQQQQQPPLQQQPDPLHHLPHRPSIPEVPAHLIMDHSQVSLQSLSSYPPSSAQAATEDDDDDDDTDDDDNDANARRRHQHVGGEEYDQDPEHFHDEDSIDYSASFIESCDIPPSASFLHSENLFTSTLDHHHHDDNSDGRRQRLPATSPPSHRLSPRHHHHHHERRHHHERTGNHSTSREQAESTTPPSPTSPLAWQDDDSSPAPDHHIRHRSGDRGQAYPIQRTITPTSSATIMTSTITTTNSASTTPSLSSPPITTPLPRLRGAKERARENGWGKDWVSGIFV
ncbi:Myotubularin- protein 14 [Actinomortierella ambigua]|uniref:Myotubularin- protein 14 n=1 Tax=Actinomortierella ambigua TaxID=1343610 RepID=A0A9P6QG21_9FUNG|nr:Myotubularin- protein 14 [Actinomortierella ambigua]